MNDFHREGAAVITHADGSEEWWSNGRPHRLDGPAFCFPEEPDNDTWYIHGKMIESSKVETWHDENEYSVPLDELEKAHFAAKFG